MSISVYNAVPMTLNDGETQHQFTLKLNPATESFRLENKQIKRNVFIGRRMFSNLFQQIRNEYGFVLGRIHYDNEEMKNGSATTAEHEHFRFVLKDDNGIEVQVEDEALPGKKFTASVPYHYQNASEKAMQLKTIIPSVLAALIYLKTMHPAI